MQKVKNFAQSHMAKADSINEDIVVSFKIFQSLSDLECSKPQFPRRKLEFKSCSADSRGAGTNAQSSYSTDEETCPTCPSRYLLCPVCWFHEAHLVESTLKSFFVSVCLQY